MKYNIKISIHNNTLWIKVDDKYQKHDLYRVVEKLVEFKPINKKWTMQHSKDVYDEILRHLFYYRVYFWLEGNHKQSHINVISSKVKIIQEFLMSHHQVLDLMYDFIVKSNKKYVNTECTVKGFIKTHFTKS